MPEAKRKKSIAQIMQTPRPVDTAVKRAVRQALASTPKPRPQRKRAA